MRKPRQDEIDDLVLEICFNEYNINPLNRKHQQEFSNIQENVANANIVVFDDYITDGPGYAGRVMLVLWSGSPSFVSSYIWVNNKIEKVEVE